MHHASYHALETRVQNPKLACIHADICSPAVSRLQTLQTIPTLRIPTWMEKVHSPLLLQDTWSWATYSSYTSVQATDAVVLESWMWVLIVLLAQSSMYDGKAKRLQ